MSDLIAPHLAALRARGLSAATVNDRKRLLGVLDRELPKGIEKALPDELAEWLGRPGLTTKSRETYWCHIVGFYRWAVRGRAQRLDWDPSEDLERPRPKRRLPRVASDDQLRHCLARLDRPVLRAVILAAGAGMRAGEIANAQREQFTRRRVTIVGKGDRTRVVPLIPEVWEEIRDCPDGPVLTNHGAPVTAAWVTRTCTRALREIGETRLTVHYFRGAFATRLRRSGVDTAAIARLLGHSSVATTQLYLAFNDDEDLVDAIAKMPGLDENVRASL